jgi:molybdenum cofactor cytidylyltransferase
MTLHPITPIILAAGDSRRMGSPKALLPYADGTFLSVILDKVKRLQLASAVVVLGKHAPLIRPSLAGREIRVLINSNPERGQLSSMQLAIAETRHSRACLVWPVDQPAVAGAVVEELIGLFDRSGALIAMPVHGGRRGHPAIFADSVCRELLGVPVEKGPKEMIHQHAGDTVLLATEDAGTVEDIDTPDEYQTLLRRPAPESGDFTG